MTNYYALWSQQNVWRFTIKKKEKMEKIFGKRADTCVLHEYFRGWLMTKNVSVCPSISVPFIVFFFFYVLAYFFFFQSRLVMRNKLRNLSVFWITCRLQWYTPRVWPCTIFKMNTPIEMWFISNFFFFFFYSRNERIYCCSWRSQTYINLIFIFRNMFLPLVITYNKNVYNS